MHDLAHSFKQTGFQAKNRLWKEELDQQSRLGCHCCRERKRMEPGSKREGKHRWILIYFATYILLHLLFQNYYLILKKYDFKKNNYLRALYSPSTDSWVDTISFPLKEMKCMSSRSNQYCLGRVQHLPLNSLACVYGAPNRFKVN